MNFFQAEGLTTYLPEVTIGEGTVEAVVKMNASCPLYPSKKNMVKGELEMQEVHVSMLGLCNKVNQDTLHFPA